MTQSQVLIVQHVPWEKPGRILDNLDDLNMSSTVVNIAKERSPICLTSRRSPDW